MSDGQVLPRAGAAHEERRLVVNMKVLPRGYYLLAEAANPPMSLPQCDHLPTNGGRDSSGFILLAPNCRRDFPAVVLRPFFVVPEGTS
jgi:hypothetical protein